MIFERSYTLSVIEQKVAYTSGKAPANIKQGYSSAWKVPPVDSSLKGIDVSTLTQNNSTTSSTGASTDGNSSKTVAGDGVLINRLHITAEINSKAEDGESATSIIRVFNANPDTRAKLEKKNAYVVLEAGYLNDTGIVFVGSSIKAFTQKQGNDMVTEIHCMDSNVQLKTSRVSFSWPPKTKYSQIIADVASSMKEQGIATAVLETKAKNLPSLPSPDETVADGGMSFQGMSSQLLDKLCTQFQYNWYISLNELYIHPKSFNTFTVQYVMRTDLIKSIAPQLETKQETPNVETPSRFKMSTFLDHRIKVGQLISIPDGKFAGKYKVISVDTQLSYLDGGNWDSSVLMEAA